MFFWFQNFDMFCLLRGFAQQNFLRICHCLTSVCSGVARLPFLCLNRLLFDPFIRSVTILQLFRSIDKFSQIAYHTIFSENSARVVSAHFLFVLCS